MTEERDICERLDIWVIDYDGSQMKDGEPPRYIMQCWEIREAAATIRWLRAALAEIAGLPDVNLDTAPSVARAALERKP